MRNTYKHLKTVENSSLQNSVQNLMPADFSQNVYTWNMCKHFMGRTEGRWLIVEKISNFEVKLKSIQLEKKIKSCFYVTSIFSLFIKSSVTFLLDFS